MSSPGTRASVEITSDGPGLVPTGAQQVSGTVRISLEGGIQPKAPVSITLPLGEAATNKDQAAGEYVLVVQALSANGAEDYLVGAFNLAARTYTFNTQHFSTFTVLGFDVGALLTPILQGLGIEVPAPDCIDKPATVAGTKFEVVSTGQTYLCVSEKNGNLVVSAHPAVAMPFLISSSAAKSFVTEPTEISLGKIGIINLARAAGYFDTHRDRAAVFPGAQATLTFPGAPTKVRLTLSRDRALLPIVLLANLFDAIGIAPLDKLGKLQCLSDTAKAGSLPNQGDSESVAAVMKSFLSCAGEMPGLSTLGKLFIAALAAGPTFVVSVAVDLMNDLAGQQSYTVDLFVTPPKNRPACTTRVNVPDGVDPRACGAAPREATRPPNSMIKSPSGNIECFLGPYSEEPIGTVSCSIRSYNFTFPVTTGALKQNGCATSACGALLILNEKGKTSISLNKGGQHPWSGTGVQIVTLPYGKFAAVGQYACLSATDGMTCWNTKSDHGFTLSKNGYDSW